MKMTDYQNCMKMQHIKMMDQFAGNLQGMKLQDMKMTDQICGA